MRLLHLASNRVRDIFHRNREARRQRSRRAAQHGVCLRLEQLENRELLSVATITDISPNHGSPQGNTQVVINGTDFDNVMNVTFGSMPASFIVISGNEIIATAPAGMPGSIVDIRVTNMFGTSMPSPADQFTYDMAALPSISSVSPNTGSTSGGTSVTLTGTDFSNVWQVRFGDTPASSFTIQSPTEIVAIAPAQAQAGSVNITVSNMAGTSEVNPNAQFNYMTALPTVSSVSPNSGPTAGGTSVTITGSEFTGVMQVFFGGVAATSFSVMSATQIVATAPAQSASGTVDITISTMAGTSATSPADQFTYTAAGPAVMSVSPNSGPATGGTSVNITGSNFDNVTQVLFDGTPASGYAVISSSQIIATAPPHAAGLVNVIVCTTAGNSAGSTMDQFTYLAVNQSPTITNPGAQYSSEGASVSLVIQAGDPDNDSLTFSATGLPAGLTIDNAGLISGTLDYFAAQMNGGMYNVTVAVADDQGGSASESFTWNVANTNVAPTLAPIPNQANVEGDYVSVAIFASDDDGDFVQFTLTGAPSGLCINGGSISGTIAPGSSGLYTVTVSADDGQGHSTSQSFIWNVTATNQPPTVEFIADQVSDEGQAISLSVSANDPNGDAVQYSLAGAPAGFQIEANGVITGTPGFSAAGTYMVTVTATDIFGASAGRTFAWTILDFNPPPTAVSQSVSGTNDEPLDIELTGADADGELVTYTMLSGPQHGTVEVYGSVAIYTPDDDYVGADSFTFQASDANAASAPATVSITVTAPADEDDPWTDFWGDDETPPPPEESGVDPSVEPDLPIDVEEDGDLVGSSTAAPSWANLFTSAGMNLGEALAYANSSTSTTDPDPEGDPGPAFIPGVHGSYQWHWTYSAHNSDLEYYLDATRSGSFNDPEGMLTPDGFSPTLSDIGSFTYTTWLKQNGEFIFNLTDVVVPFAITDGTTPTIVFPGDDWFMMHGPEVTWDHQQYTDSYSLDSSGTVASADGHSYYFARRQGSGSSWTEDRTVETGAEVFTTTYGGSQVSNLTYSNRAANVPTTLQYDADGYALNLFVTPAAGTTYYESWFSSGDYTGASTTTYAVNDGIRSLAAYVSHGSSGGTAGYRYFATGARTVGNRNDPVNPTEDKYSWTSNYLQTGTYNIVQDYDLTYSGAPTNYTGTVETESTSKGKVQSSLELTDAYFRSGLLGTTSGTYKESSTGGSTYDNTDTALQTYSNGILTGDSLDYDYRNKSDVSVSTSDYSAYSASTILLLAGLELGTRSGVQYLASGDKLHSESIDAGTQDFFNHTGTMDSSSSYSGSNWFLAFGSSTTTYGGGSMATSTNFAFGSGTRSGSSWTDGPYCAPADPNVPGDVTMTGGASHDQAQSQDKFTSLDWSKANLNNGLTRSTTSTTTSESSDQSTSDLTYDPDGKINGTLLAYADGSSTVDTTTTVTGTKPIYNLFGLGTTQIGAKTYNDRSHEITTSSYVVDSNLGWTHDVANGSVTTVQTNSILVTSSMDEATNVNNGEFKSTLKAPNEFLWLLTRESVFDLWTDDNYSGTRVLKTDQISFSSSTLTADGKLADNNGHTGSWTLTVESKSRVNDHIVANYNWSNEQWQKTGGTLDVIEEKSILSKYTQEDNGLGCPADSDTLTSEERKHELKTTDSSSSKIDLHGPEGDYTYDTRNKTYHYRYEMSEGTTHNLPAGETRTYYSQSAASDSFSDLRTGSVLGGVKVPTFQSTRTETHSSYQAHNTTDSPTLLYESHTQSMHDHENLRQLSLANSYDKGSDIVSSWWKQIDKTAAWTWWGTTGDTTIDFVHTWDDPWGGPEPGVAEILWTDFQSAYPYAHAALQTVGGVAEIVASWGLITAGSGIVVCAGWTGIGAVGGGFMVALGAVGFLHGCDTVAAGLATAITGKVQETFTKQLVTGWTGSEGIGAAVDMGIPLVVGLANGLAQYGLRAGWLNACFAAGTPLLTPEGSKPIEQFKVGDQVLARSEFNPNGPVEPKAVEETFVTEGRIFHLHVAGQVIRTTSEHPFWICNKGWLHARELRIGDRLGSHDGQVVIVEDLLDTGEVETVYNLRVADYHTYFVGEQNWGFSVWAHNLCAGNHHFVTRALGSTVPYGSKLLNWLSAANHTALHKALNAFLKPLGMTPSWKNPGWLIRQKFSPAARIQALDSFYRQYLGGQYYQAFLNELQATLQAGMFK